MTAKPQMRPYAPPNVDAIDREIVALECQIVGLKLARSILMGTPAVKASPALHAEPSVPREKTRGEIAWEEDLSRKKAVIAQKAADAHQMRDDGHTTKDIAGKLGMSRQTIKNYLKRPKDDITAALMGDPILGRSALDRRAKT